MDYNALAITIAKLNEAIEFATQIDKNKQLTQSEDWIWNMITLAKVTDFFEKELEDLETFNDIFSSDQR
jgi:hypothetical protein